MTIQNKFYMGFPVHFYSFQEDHGNFNFVFYNEKEILIKQITIAFGQEKHPVEVESKEPVIRFSINVDDVKQSMSKPVLFSCQTDKETFLLSDFNDVYTVKGAESIYTLGQERYLYNQLIAKNVKKPKKDIQYVADQTDNYWHCTCGNYNLSSFTSCKHCGNEKEQIFKTVIPPDIDRLRTHNVKIFKGAFFWIMLSFALELAYQSFNGDYMFENTIKNQFFPVFNRLLLPFVLILLAAAILLTLIYYKRVLGLVLKVIFYSIIIYLNIISAINFVGTAYNLLFLVAIDIMVLSMFYTKYKEQRLNLKFIALVAFAIISMGFMAYQWTVYSNYSLIVIDGGLRLNVETDKTEYQIPDRINNMKVKEVYFSVRNEYPIEKLTINKYVDNIFIYSTAVLPDLDEVTIDPANTAFYVQDNVLYNANHTIKLVPISMKTLTVHSETILSGQFRDLANLETLTIGNEVKYIGDEAFANNINLKTLTFESGTQLEEIGKQAFLNCSSLETLELPITLQSMGLGAFKGCNNLTYVKTPFLGEERETTESLSDSTDMLVYMFGSRNYLATNLIPNSLETIEVYDIDRIHNVTFYGAKYLRHIILPDNLLHLGQNSFYNCTSLEEFTVPNGVTTIDPFTFAYSGLKEITIPASVTEIVFNAFLNCDDLVTVNYLGNIDDLNIATTGNETFIAALDSGN